MPYGNSVWATKDDPDKIQSMEEFNVEVVKQGMPLDLLINKEMYYHIFYMDLVPEAFMIHFFKHCGSIADMERG